MALAMPPVGTRFRTFRRSFSFISLLSNSIILEPYYSNSPVIKGTIDESEFQYIIHHKDGSYSLVVAGQKAKIDNIYDSALRGLKIVEEE